MKVGKEKGDFELTSGMKVGCLEVIHRETANPNGCLEHAQRCSKWVLSLGYLWVGNLGACSSPRGEPQGLEVGGQPCWRDCPQPLLSPGATAPQGKLLTRLVGHGKTFPRCGPGTLQGVGHPEPQVVGCSPWCRKVMCSYGMCCPGGPFALP